MYNRFSFSKLKETCKWKLVNKCQLQTISFWSQIICASKKNILVCFVLLSCTELFRALLFQAKFPMTLSSCFVVLEKSIVLMTIQYLDFSLIQVLFSNKEGGHDHLVSTWGGIPWTEEKSWKISPLPRCCRHQYWPSPWQVKTWPTWVFD